MRKLTNSDQGNTRSPERALKRFISLDRCAYVPENSPRWEGDFMPRRSLSAFSFANFGGLLLVLGLAAILIVPFTPSLVSAQVLPFGFNPYRFQNVDIGGGGGFISGIVFSKNQRAALVE